MSLLGTGISSGCGVQACSRGDDKDGLAWYGDSCDCRFKASVYLIGQYVASDVGIVHLIRRSKSPTSSRAVSTIFTFQVHKARALLPLFFFQLPSLTAAANHTRLQRRFLSFSFLSSCLVQSDPSTCIRMAIPLKQFTWKGQPLGPVPGDLNEVRDSLEVTTWIVDQLRQCGYREVLRLLRKTQVRCYNLLLLLLSCNAFLKRTLTIPFPPPASCPPLRTKDSERRRGRLPCSLDHQELVVRSGDRLVHIRKKDQP